MWLLANRRFHGPWLGLAVNVGWVTMWLYTKQYGFLFLDVGIVAIYFDTLRKQFKGEW